MLNIHNKVLNIVPDLANLAVELEYHINISKDSILYISIDSGHYFNAYNNFMIYSNFLDFNQINFRYSDNYTDPNNASPVQISIPKYILDNPKFALTLLKSIILVMEGKIKVRKLDHSLKIQAPQVSA